MRLASTRKDDQGNDLYWVQVQGWFALAIIDSTAGTGVTELHIAACCTSQEIADSLAAKINEAVELVSEEEWESRKGCAIDLFLTRDEAMCIGVASQNCVTESLPSGQIKKLEAWFEEWKASPFAGEDRWVEATLHGMGRAVS